MMAESHPTEIELLDYVEGDAGPSAAHALRMHVEACSACAATVSQLALARETLRAAPLLELPATRAEALLARLPRQERDRPTWLESLRSPRRLALVLAPAAAAAAAAIVVLAGNGERGEREAAPPAAAVEELRAEEGAPADASAGAAEAPLEEAAPLEEPAAPPAAEPPALEATGGPVPVATLAGQPGEIARILEEAGFSVQVADGAVTVTGASEADVTKALEGLPPGDDVPVFVEP